MKAKFFKAYVKLDETVGKKLPHVIYEITGEDNIQEYVDNTPLQYQRFADEEKTRPLFFSRLYADSAKEIVREVHLILDEEGRYVSPELTEQREEYNLSKAFSNLQEL